MAHCAILRNQVGNGFAGLNYTRYVANAAVANALMFGIHVGDGNCRSPRASQSCMDGLDDSYRRLSLVLVEYPHRFTRRFESADAMPEPIGYEQRVTVLGPGVTTEF